MKEVSVEIELLENTNTQDCPLQLPKNITKKGSIEEGDVKVLIAEGVYTQIEELACSDTKKELGSILLGSSLLFNGKTHVIISAFIEAKYADATASTLTFTHETWNYVHAEQSRLYLAKIVGWQRTHPVMACFLARLGCSENFFNRLSGCLCDRSHQKNIFQWKDNKVQKLGVLPLSSQGTALVLTL